MMDIYANAKCLDNVLALFQDYFLHYPGITQYSILMKAYGNCNLADISEQVLVTLLNENHNIDIRNIDVLFHTLIDAWAMSYAPDAMYRAFNVVKIMKDHSKCKQYNIQPNVNTYTALIRCLHTVVSSRTNIFTDKSEIGRFAEEIISEMEDVCVSNVISHNDSAQPNILAYTTAIKACLYVQDYTRAEAILLRLENSQELNVPTKFYNELIYQCTQPGTSAAAIQGEKFLSHMIHLSQTLRKTIIETKRSIV